MEVAAEKLAQERREANLVVYGVPEDTPLPSVFPDVTIISTRRLGRPQANAPKPRPALVLLPSLDAKRSVMRQFRSRLRAQGITLNHDKTPAQQARCETLLPRLHYLRSLHKVAFFDYDRLMVVGEDGKAHEDRPSGGNDGERSSPAPASAGGRGRRWEAPPGPPPRPPPPPSPAPAPSGAAGGKRQRPVGRWGQRPARPFAASTDVCTWRRFWQCRGRARAWQPPRSRRPQQLRLWAQRQPAPRPCWRGSECPPPCPGRLKFWPTTTAPAGMEC